MKSLQLKLWLFLIILPICNSALSQTKIFDAGDEIIDFNYNNKGKLHILTKREIITIVGTQELNRFTITNKGGKHIISISDTTFFVLSDYSYQLFVNGMETFKDTLSEMITSYCLADSIIYLGTAGSGIYAFSLENQDLNFIAFENEFINDLIIYKNTLYAALDNGVAAFRISNKLETRNNLGKIIEHIAILDENIVGFTQTDDMILLDLNLNEIRSEIKLLTDIVDVQTSMSEVIISSSDRIFTLNANFEIFSLHNTKHSNIQSGDNLLFYNVGESIYSSNIVHQKIYTGTPVYSLFYFNHTVWAGSDGKIFELRSNIITDSIHVTLRIPDLPISALLVFENNIIAGTLGEGLYIINRATKLITNHIIFKEVNKNNIIDIQYRWNKIWIAYLNGVIILNPHTWEIENDFSSLLGLNYLYCFLPVSPVEFYIGTSSNGLIHYNKGEVTTYLDKYTIQSLASLNNELYIGCENYGLFKLTDGITTNILADVTIQNIDSIQDYLCISTTNETLYYNDKSGIYRSIDEDDLEGVQLNSFTFSELYSYIGYEKGILLVKNDRIKSLHNIQICLSNPSIFNKTIQNNKSHFKYNENTISFSFNSNSYYNLDNTNFKYRLIGLDSTWYETKISNVNYYNLAPGNYTFEVVLGLDKNFQPSNIKSYSFLIDQPFWNKWWFYIIIFILLITLIYSFIKYREKQIVNNQRREHDKIKFEFEQLKNQIDPHFLFNSLNSLIGLIEENPSSAIEATQLLAELYRNILKYEGIDLISVQEELKLAQQYLKIHQLRYEDLITLNIDNIDNIETVGSIIPLSCQFLIENIIKHNIINSSYPMIINIDIENEYLTVSNLKKIKSQVYISTGIGLLNLKNRYKLLTKKPVLIENSDEKFVVRIPLINV